jgi:hypothetical protein
MAVTGNRGRAKQESEMEERREEQGREKKFLKEESEPVHALSKVEFASKWQTRTVVREC